MMSQREGGFLITQIHHLGRRVFSELMRKHDIEIGPGQGRILFSLWQRDGIPMKELSKKTLLRKSTMSELIDNLESTGYVARVQSPEDKRKTLIKLTEKTQRLQNTYIKLSAEMTKIFYKDFTLEEIDELEAYLHRILENLISHETM